VCDGNTHYLFYLFEVVARFLENLWTLALEQTNSVFIIKLGS
jgi:hypothetical protein